MIPNSLIKFQKLFSTESACSSFLFKRKWPQGFVCPKCGGKNYLTIETRKNNLYQCSACHHQTTVIVGTIFEKTRTPLVKWFLTIYLISRDKRGISATFIANEIDVTYKTAWLMLHKIRQAMTHQTKSELLSGTVELDDAFFGTSTNGKKRGRGTEKVKVIVAVSLNVDGNPKEAKIEVIPNVKSKTIVQFAESSIEKGSTVISDAFNSYRKLSENGYTHNYKRANLQKKHDLLHWLHIVISNAKTFVKGTFHGLESKHFQAYLNEYCFRFNRRYKKDGIFSSLLSCCAVTPTITYAELRG